MITFLLETEGSGPVFSKSNNFNVRKLMPEMFNEALSRRLLQDIGHDKAKVLNDAIEGALD